MIRAVLIFILLLGITEAYAAENRVREQYGDLILALIDSAVKESEPQKDACNSTQNSAVSVNQLGQCKAYLNKIYLADDYDSYLGYAKLLLSIGVTEEHAPEFSRLLRSGVDEIVSLTYFMLADYYYKNVDYKRALKYLKKIQSGLKDDVVYKGLYIYGIIYLDTGDSKSALRSLERIDKSSILYPYARYNMALVRMKQSWWSDAEEYLSDAIVHIKENNTDNQQLSDRILLTQGYSRLNRKDYRRSLRSFKEIPVNSVFRAQALMGAAMAYIAQGNYQQAAPILKKLLSDADDKVKIDAMIILPGLYEKAGDMVLAIKFYKAAIQFMENNKITADTNPDKKGSGLKLNSFHKEFLNTQIRMMEAVRKATKLPEHKRYSTHLISVFHEAITGHAQNGRDELNNTMQSYLAQAKLQLAYIYDKSVVTR